MIVIVDYGMGNLRSVSMKFERLKIPSKISRSPSDILGADKLVLPGVGHFAEGMKNIRDFGLFDLLNEAVIIKKIPVLGICLGMQLLTKHSEEGDAEGLGWIDAVTKKFNFKNDSHLRIPHVGWNQVSQVSESKLLQEIPDQTRFYFTHTYAVECANPKNSVGETTYGIKFSSVIQKDHIFGTQFHPEKSHLLGLKLIQNFSEQN
jgi:glutamine amidotransferase